MASFGTLSYSQKNYLPIGSPVEQLGKLYQKKQDDFDYVVDNTELINTALNNFKYNEEDSEKVAQAKDYFKNTINNFSVEGDLENRVLDTKRLANDINDRFGLNAVQEDYKKKQEYIQNVQKQYDAGHISKRDMDMALAYTKKKNKQGVLKNDLGYQSEFSGKNVIRDVDLAKKALDVANGIKADSIVDKNGNSYRFQKTPNGYINILTGEGVSADKVAQVTKSYLLADNDFKDRVDNEVFYELDKFTEDPETGKNKEFSMQDLLNETGVTEDALKKKYGVDDVSTLDASAVYKDMRTEQLVNQYIQPAINKESYSKLNNQFVQDWQLRDTTKAAREAKAAATIREAGILNTYDAVDKYTSEDFERTGKVYNDAKTNVIQLKKDLQELNKNNANPDQIRDKKAEIDNQQRLISLIESRNQKIVELTPGLKSEIESFVKSSEDTGQNRANRTPFIHGLSINEGELQRLVYGSSTGILNDEELKKYIDYDKIKQEANSEEGAKLVYNNSLKVLRDKVSIMGAGLKQTVEKGDILYNENYSGIILPDNLSPEEKRHHPIAILQGQLDQIKDRDNQFYDKLLDVNTGLPISNLIQEKEGVNANEIDWKDVKLNPLITKTPSATGSYNNSIVIDVPIGEDKEVKRYTVKYNDAGYNQFAETKINDYRKLLLNKPNLNTSDRNALTEVNLSLFNGTREGQEMDLLNLSDMSNRETVNIMLPNRIPATIQAFKTESPQNKAYYLVERQGNEIKYWAENAEGQRALLSENELKNTNEYRALGGNSIRDIKTKIANTLYNSGVLDKN